MSRTLTEKTKFTLSDLKEYVGRIYKVLDDVEKGYNLKESCSKYEVALVPMRRFLSRRPMDTSKTPINDGEFIQSEDILRTVCSPAEYLWLRVTGSSEILYAPGDIDETMDFLMYKVLTEREKKILQLLFYNSYSYRQVGQEYNITDERVRQIMNVAIKKLSNSNYTQYMKMGYSVFEMQREEELKKRERDFERKYNDRINTLMQREDYLALLNKFIEENKNKGINRGIELEFVPIEKLNLPTRAYNALSRSGYKTVGKVATMSRRELANVRNLGNGSVDAVVNAIHDVYNIDII